jgi:hypothetical protein
MKQYRIVTNGAHFKIEEKTRDEFQKEVSATARELIAFDPAIAAKYLRAVEGAHSKGFYYGLRLGALFGFAAAAFIAALVAGLK